MGLFSVVRKAGLRGLNDMADGGVVGAAGGYLMGGQAGQTGEEQGDSMLGGAALGMMFGAGSGSRRMIMMIAQELKKRAPHVADDQILREAARMAENPSPQVMELMKQADAAAPVPGAGSPAPSAPGDYDPRHYSPYAPRNPRSPY